jgi:hypothetical protein
MKTPKKLIKRTREVVETPYGKNIQTTLYNRLTKKGVSKEKDITYRTKDEPRIKYVDKQVVRRDKDLNWKSSKETKKLLNDGKKIKSDVTYKTYKEGGSLKAKKVKVTAGGEKHVVYKKTTKKGEGKIGHIMVNHPTKNKGQWDTIDLTAKGKAKTVAQGVAATKKWHKDNPYYNYKGKGNGK